MEEVKEEKQKKLPYFHRTLSPEETALIGDISPKPITTADDKIAAASAETASGKAAVSGSAWNTAMTWEERDCTQWAIKKLPTLFEGKETLPTSTKYAVTLKGLSNAEGTAQIAHVRGKARFMYELSFDLKFSVSDETTEKKHKGKIAVSDVINDQLDDVEFAITWDKPPPGSEATALRNAVIGGSTLKRLIREKMTIFEADFRQI